MKEPKRYYCGNGDGMFEDDKNGHWIKYSEHKAIVEEMKQALCIPAVISSVCNCTRKHRPYEHNLNECRICEKPIWQTDL